MTTIRTYIQVMSLMISCLFPGWLWADETSDDSLILDKEDIKVYFYNHDNFKFGTFKATTHIDSSLDSVLAVMFDHHACQDWIYSCTHSHTIKDISFNERYHYQMLDLPFPFDDREFLFHSMLKQDPVTRIITIRTTTTLNDCHDENFYLCEHPKEKGHVTVNISVGLFKLEPVDGGVNLTWIQYTDPDGNLPGWLVNQFIEQTPYQTLKALAQKVKEPHYQNMRLIYDTNDLAIGLESHRGTSHE